MIVTSEIGKDTGDAPGECQFWVEREHLDEALKFAGGPNLPEGQPMRWMRNLKPPGEIAY
ncbi:MAG: hypothetical protein ABI286_08340 [Edaphobacter sp.]